MTVEKLIDKVLAIICILGSNRVVPNPVPESVTFAALKEVKYVGVIQMDGRDVCMGTFLSHSFLATSCRCIGDTSIETGAFQKYTPDNFQVRTWGKHPVEIKKAEKFYFYELCGVEANKVLLDLGLVQTAQFSQNAVSPIGIPDASVFRFYEYIYSSTVKETVCVSTTMNVTTAAPGETVLVQLKEPSNCQFREICDSHEDILAGHCVLPTLISNHICGIAATNCTVSSGAPLVCHGMLMGINAGTRNCNTVINPSLYVRMDFVMIWIQETMCPK